MKVETQRLIDCELFSRISSILAFLSDSALRFGFHPHIQEGLYRGNFMTRPLLYNPCHHISRQFLTLIDAIDSTTHPKAKRQVTAAKLEIPTIEFEKKEIEFLSELFMLAMCNRLQLPQITLRWGQFVFEKNKSG